jgi:hypothetical protein
MDPEKINDNDDHGYQQQDPAAGLLWNKIVSDRDKDGPEIEQFPEQLSLY